MFIIYLLSSIRRFRAPTPALHYQKGRFLLVLSSVCHLDPLLFFWLCEHTLTIIFLKVAFDPMVGTELSSHRTDTISSPLPVLQLLNLSADNCCFNFPSRSDY